MRKIKFSLEEKKIVRAIVVFVLIQFLIILVFVRELNMSRPIKAKDTKQIDITVEDTYCIRLGTRYSENLFVVVADSEKYWFEYHRFFDKYSVDQLYQSISEGDKLHLTYYETSYILFGNVKVVVDAQTEIETYRSFESYNQAKRGLPTLVTIIFSIIETFFAAIILLYVWLNKNTVKILCKKLKKCINKNTP